MRTPHQNDLARHRGGFIFSSVIGLVLACAIPTFAQTDNPNVARLSLVQGNVAVQRGDAQQNVAGTLNAPLLAGDALTTGADGRAEVQYDGTSMVRVASNAQLRFANLDPGNRVVQLAQGTVNLDVLRGDDGSSQVDTPSISMRAAESGRYRVTVSNNGDTLITVRSGRADILFPQGARELMPGSTLLVRGSASNPSYRYIGVVAYDSFDSFNADRDQEWLARIGPNDATYSNIDGDDLDAYGQWVSVPSYGRVWSPYQTAGWAPYRYGQWVWEDGYGWTWVSSDPWGWAPYHYGRWFHTVGYGWCWYPPAPNPFWAPALVGFVSFGGPGFNISFGLGNIGWVPLAPWEAYHPWWGGRYGYGPRVVNITNITINNYYRNARYGGFTGVDARHWQQGNFSHNIAINPRSFNGMHVQAFHGALPIAPTNANLRFSNHTLPSTLASSRFDSTEHFAGRTNTITRTPFVAQHDRIVQAIQHPQFQNVSTAHTTATTGLTHTAVIHNTVTHSDVFPLQTTNTNYSRPVHTNDAWTRFNQSRGLPVNTGASVNNTRTNNNTRTLNNTSTSANTGYQGTTQTYHRPVNTSTSGSSTHTPAPHYSSSGGQNNDAWSRFSGARGSGNASRASNTAYQDTNHGVNVIYSNPENAGTTSRGTTSRGGNGSAGLETYSRHNAARTPPSYAAPAYSRPNESYSRPTTYTPRSSGPPSNARSGGGSGGSSRSHDNTNHPHPH